VVLSLERLGRHPEAADLAKRFQAVAESRQGSNEPLSNARAHYLRGLIAGYNGNPAKDRELVSQAVKIELDYIAPRFELRSDTIDPAGH
jgi:hypothetical protein